MPDILDGDISHWQTGFKCISCKRALARHEVMDSWGTCPYCGNGNDSTIVDTERFAYKVTKLAVGWYLWPVWRKYEYFVEERG